MGTSWDADPVSSQLTFSRQHSTRFGFVPMQLPAAWQGVYSYDSMPEQLGLSETAFDLIIRPRRLGRFDGEIHESEPGIPESATVRGWAISKRIRFTKRYPSFWIYDHPGSPRQVPGLNPSKLLYRGDLIEDGDGLRIVGTWRIPTFNFQLDGKRFKMPLTTGTWSARSLD